MVPVKMFINLCNYIRALVCLNNLHCNTFQYFTLLVLLFLTEFLLGSLAFVFRGGIGRTLANELKYGIEKFYNSSDLGGRITPSVASIWDSLQSNVTHFNEILSTIAIKSNFFFSIPKVHCCGVNSYEDWYDISSWPGNFESSIW